VKRIVFVLAAVLYASPAMAVKFIVTNTNTSGDGSLAQAITDANATATADIIEFAVASLGNITINGRLPAITQPVTIDGYTQGTATENSTVSLASGTNAVLHVQLDASDVPIGDTMLQVDKGPTVLKGLSIHGMDALVTGIGIGPDASDVVVQGCFIGVTAAGADNGQGIGIRTEGTNVTIGGTAIGARNLSSGNSSTGIEVRGGPTFIRNNLIGTDATGDGSFPNGDGITVTGPDADDVEIGGTGESLPNIISGNNGAGVYVADDAGGNVQIRGNRYSNNGGLAIDLGGDGPTPNDETDSDEGPNSLQNYPVISMAYIVDDILTVEGWLQGPAATYDLEYYASVNQDQTGFGEGEIPMASDDEVSFGGTHYFRHQFVIDPSIPEYPWVTVTAENLTTHETSEFSRAFGANEVADELVVTNSNDSGAGSLRAAIEAANSDADYDAVVFAIPGPVQPIRPTSPLTITEQVLVDGYSQQGATPNSASFGTNAEIVVDIDGGLEPAATETFHVNANVVELRGLTIRTGKGIGVLWEGGVDGRISGCFIGTDTGGTLDKGNASHGIFVGPDVETLGIGVGGLFQRNIISGNAGHGIRVTGDYTTIQGNLIGTDRTGTQPLGNSLSGIDEEGLSAGIGNRNPGDSLGNVIRFNADHGVIVGQSAAQIGIIGNTIDSNGKLGIELATGNDAVTPNDANDVDAGANNLQNFPVLTGIDFNASSFEISGTLDVPAVPGDQTYRIAVYANDECDPSGFGEGTAYVGYQEVVLTNASQSFSFELGKGLSEGMFVTATASDSEGNTSEFSQCFEVTTPVAICGDANSSGGLSSSDALLVLKAGVGTESCQLCVCDVNDSATITSGDALLVLKKAVGQAVVLDCPVCVASP
jgi:hypothetical protein